ncbi:hypothetical protein CLV71_114129 [Actinophytocola oryzae]|uniref:DUF5134 domain-containing protein n=1 Tax=Actinophytocola oryzae TaxID=502181 RepID=A0A4R7V5J5_9PSEU|nr:hypothetical protein CLV71_114129 [Actinophytocola oryzae]
MIESTPLRLTLLVVLVAAGVWFVWCGLRSGSGGTTRPAADRISDLAHAIMAVAMIVMIWPMA